MTLSPWLLLLLAVPLLLLGQFVLRSVPVLARFSIPVPVVGGLLFALACLLLRTAGLELGFATKVNAGWWTWLVTPDHEWLARPARNLNLPLLVGFFTCVGLAAPLRLLASGGRMLVILLAGTTVLAVVQNAAGVALATALGAPALLGVVCGSLTLVGGHGTALGFSSRFEQAGMASAATIGASAATFGLVAGALLSGPLGAWLIRRNARPASAAGEAQAGVAKPRPAVADFIADVRSLAALGRSALGHLLLVAFCVKAGAWISFGLDRIGAALPAYMGALLLAFTLRAIHDAAGWTWLRSDTVNRIAAVLLPLFLVVTLAPLNLAELAAVAGPMLAILSVNIALTLAFAAFVVWPLLGRDHEAAVATAGLAGYGIGSTATAVAAMDAITRQHGKAPRATTLVPPTGGFLIDLTNAPVIGAFLRWM
ncbi:sodium/glutamate symporter [Pseudoduganella sp. OTU4001]|uniref:sodium/glutamate symporter n=1 Tax=Pseudoduganella sp. OTU4001 TaxID=3043854 RepID=UPI00313E8F05